MESDSSSIKEPPDIRFNPNSIILHLKQIQGDRNRLFQQHAKIQKLLNNRERAFAIVPCHYADLSQHKSLVAVQKETATSYS
jgi:hypothetical protein